MRSPGDQKHLLRSADTLPAAFRVLVLNELDMLQAAASCAQKNHPPIFDGARGDICQIEATVSLKS
jgi:hypothetical protein